MKTAILNIRGIHSFLSTSPLTLIHNDCNPRNLCLRKPERVSEGGEIKTCLYDWELATIDVPQRDVAEFLAFTLMPCTAQNVRLELLDFYRCNLEHFSGSTYPLDRYSLTVCNNILCYIYQSFQVHESLQCCCS